MQIVTHLHLDCFERSSYALHELRNAATTHKWKGDLINAQYIRGQIATLMLIESHRDTFMIAAWCPFLFLTCIFHLSCLTVCPRATASVGGLSHTL